MSLSTPGRLASSTPSHLLVNLDQIEMVRSRMIQINDAQGDFIQNVQATDELKTNFRNIMLYPKEAPPLQSESTFATLLRTKQIPEIEQLEDEIKNDIAIEEGLDNYEKEAIEKSDENKLANLLDEWVKKYEEHGNVAAVASEYYENNIGEIINTKKRLEDSDEKIEEFGDGINDITLESVLAYISSGIEK
nr:4477_t:CDS:2 [Entrophospora candida]